MTPSEIDFESRPMSDEQRERVSDNIKAAAALLYAIRQTPHSHERSCAITKLEECVMWANKVISRETD